MSLFSLSVRTWIGAVMMCAAVCVSAAPSPTFEKVPVSALKALAGARGKPIRTGFVFINGHYIRPPYVVARYGTAITINNKQITDQVIPWKAFLATQKGGAEMPDSVPVAASEASVSSAVTAVPAAAAPAAAAATKSVDDLFDDEDSTPAKPAASSSASARARAAVSDVESNDTGPFTPNERSKALLKRINTLRTDIDRRLRNGQICFFGTAYAPINVTSRLAAGLLDTLPGEMRDANDAADLYTRMRTKGFLFIGAALCTDLINNQADYLLIADRWREICEDQKLQNLLNAGSKGRGL